jgi:small subunit ribosomal protein S4
MAQKMKGVTGENLLRLLEMRLDNVVFRMGFADSRPQARQLVLHEHFTVNGKKVNIPSYQVNVGDVIAVAENSAQKVEGFKELREGPGRAIVQWLSVDFENLKGTVTAQPAREDIDIPIEEQLIVELYSK